MFQQVVTDKVITDSNGAVVKAYGPEAVATLSSTSPADSVRNADSYRWFATAAYLDGYDWSRTINGWARSSAIVARSRNMSTSATSGRGTVGWPSQYASNEDDDMAEAQGIESELKRTTFFWRRLFS